MENDKSELIRNLFGQSLERTKTAIIGSFNNSWLGLSDSYYESAVELLRGIANDKTLMDVYVLPILFLLRHALELKIKCLLVYTNKWIGKEDTKTHSHNLMSLYSLLRKNIDLLSPDLLTDYNAIGYKIEKIHLIDTKSDCFRYPAQKEIMELNSNVYIDMGSIFIYFDDILVYLSNLLDYLDSGRS